MKIGGAFASVKKILTGKTICAALLGLAAIVCAVVYWHLSRVLQSQLVAERFRGDSDIQFEQTTAFFPAGGETDRQGVFTFQQEVDSALLEASIETDNGGSLWMDAYCGTGNVTVTGEKDTAEVSAIGVGGDFFQFHPLYLRSGVYISGDDLMEDRVVLNVELAWRLFGGTDVAGLTVTISGEPYLVAGVVEMEDDFASKKAYSDSLCIFMSIDALSALTDCGISCYELVCASPVSGFAEGILQDGYANAVTVTNTGRFSLSSEIELLKSFTARSVRQAPVSYTYWENAAKVMEDTLCLILILIVMLSIFPVLLLLIGLARLVKKGVRRLKASAPGFYNRYVERRWEKKHGR